MDKDNYPESDIVISIDSLVKATNAINVSRQVTEYEIEQIKKHLYVLQLDPNKRNKNDNSGSGIWEDQLIISNATCKTKAEAIALGCKMLLEAGKVEPGFLEDVLHRESIAPTAIGNGVAIPHGSSDYVKHFSMCLIRLKKHIVWADEDKVDLVFVLALTQSELHSFNSFFGNFYTVINDKNILKRIREAENSKDIEKYFFKKDRRKATLLGGIDYV